MTPNDCMWPIWRVALIGPDGFTYSLDYSSGRIHTTDKAAAEADYNKPFVPRGGWQEEIVAVALYTWDFVNGDWIRVKERKAEKNEFPIGVPIPCPPQRSRDQMAPF